MVRALKSLGNKISFFDVALLTLILFSIFAYALTANLDLSIGGYALGMDERISFDGVRNILHPKSTHSFFYAIYNGGDHRYGRILWNSIALAVFLPDLLFGEQGQIVGARMFQVILLFGSVLLISFGFVKRAFLRVVLIGLLLTLPFSTYYMSLPKPEPLAILFICLFLYFYFHRKRPWVWVFLGLAFGTKISMLPVVIIFFFLECVTFIKNKNWKWVYGEFGWSEIYYFLLGLCIAVPILTPALAGIAFCDFFVSYLIKKRPFLIKYDTLMRVIGYALILLSCKKWLSIWIGSTFLNTHHGSDLLSVNAVTWTLFLYEKWHGLPKYLWASFTVSILIFLIFSLHQFFSQNQTPRRDRVAMKIGLMIFFLGCVLNLSIFFGVQRLWGFYLYPGVFFMISGAFILIDVMLDEAYRPKLWLANLPKYFCYFVALHTLAIFYVWFSTERLEFSALSKRTSSQEFLEQSNSYELTLKFLEFAAEGEKGGRVLMVAYDPAMFLPISTSKYQIKEFWGPFKSWGDEPTPDIIVFGASHNLQNKVLNPASSQYKDEVQERNGYIEYVVEPADRCLKKVCYRKALSLPNGGEILTKEVGVLGKHTLLKSI